MRTRVETPIIALDPSSTFCGWSLFIGVALVAHGTVKRGKNTLTEYAAECSKEIYRALALADAVTMKGLRLGELPEVYYEINDRQKIPRERQKSMRKQAQGAGRILQALGVEGQERQADSRTKERRARECSLIYGVEDCPVNEHELDAIAVGHSVVCDVGRLAKM